MRDIEQISKEMNALHDQNTHYAKIMTVIQVINLALIPLYLYIANLLIVALDIPPVFGFFIITIPMLVALFVYLYYTRINERKYDKLLDELKSHSIL